MGVARRRQRCAVEDESGFWWRSAPHPAGQFCFAVHLHTCADTGVGSLSGRRNSVWSLCSGIARVRQKSRSSYFWSAPAAIDYQTLANHDAVFQRVVPAIRENAAASQLGTVRTISGVEPVLLKLCSTKAASGKSHSL